MGKKLVFIFLIFFASLKVKAQSGISVAAEMNYNTFSHKDLRSFQQQLSRDINGVRLRVNDDFRANIGYSVGVKVEEINVLYFFSYNSTGGKISYSDYSGLIRVTQLLQAYTLGGEYQFELSEEDSRQTLFFGARGLANFSTLELKSHSEISGAVSNESFDLNSIDFGIGARFIYDIPVYIVKLRLSAGYDFVLGGEFRLAEDREMWLEDNEGDKVKPGWSGFRTGIGVVVPL